MNLIKRAGLAGILSVATLFNGCPESSNPPRPPTTTTIPITTTIPQDRYPNIDGFIDAGNDTFLGELIYYNSRSEPTKYEFWSQRDEQNIEYVSDVRITLPSQRVIKIQRDRKIPVHVETDEGSVTISNYSLGSMWLGDVTFRNSQGERTDRMNLNDLFIYPETSKEGVDEIFYKYNRGFVCDKIGGFLDDYRTMRKVRSMIKFAGCIGGVALDVATMPDFATSLLICAGSYKLSEEISNATYGFLQNASDFAFDCEFEQVNFPERPLPMPGFIDEGFLDFRLNWDNKSNLDLMIRTPYPSGEWVYPGVSNSETGGAYVRDDTNGLGPEIVQWGGDAPRGEYIIKVYCLNDNDAGVANYNLSVKQRGREIANFENDLGENEERKYFVDVD